MPLLKLFEADKDAVLGLPIEAIVQMAGGKLLDGNASSKEFRSFLGRIESENLLNYAQQCLDKDSKFSDSGLALQDIVNEIGRRLEFHVENGRYRGKANESETGQDGIWRNDGKNFDILIEVKTVADSFAISIKKIADYRRELVDKGEISEGASLLFVVGRGDTSSLEDQIRGSDYANEARLISVESLSKLLRIKLEYDDDATANTIKEILQPFEYTKIDKIIDIAFTAAQNKETESQDEDVSDSEDETGQNIKKFASDPVAINKRRSIAIQSVAKSKGIEFLQHRKTLFWDQNKARRACIVVSRRHPPGHYWYGHHKNHKDFLEGGEESYLILVCIDRDECFVIPYDFVKSNLENLLTKRNREGWHIKIEPDNQDAGKIIWNMSKVQTKKSISQFAVPMITKPDESS